MVLDKKFKMLDEEFVCDVCSSLVKPLGYTARDHCPKCLCSKHVDINPGDRKSNCLGVLKPIRIDFVSGGEMKIVYKCLKCGMIKRNKVAFDDDMELILKIMREFSEK